MNLDRAAGVLLHPTSLPGPGGIGDLGGPAHRMLEWLDQAGFRLWQVLPLSPVGRGWSPYQSTSSFAGNPLLIDLDLLAGEGLLRGEGQIQPSVDRVDFGRVHQMKMTALAAAADRWRRGRRPDQDDFETWSFAHQGWLDDFALFMALRIANGGRPWTKWPSGVARRDPEELARARRSLASEIEFQRILQYWFYRQWNSLHAAAADRGIRLIGDLPIYPDHDSADVWVRPDLFKLDSGGECLFLAGVPPDAYSATGQLWEAPVYQWENHRRDGFTWWIERVRHALSCFDVIRLDHFRGLEAFWEIPASAQTAEAGRWVESPGRDLLGAVREALGDLPIIAEDLGYITPEVVGLREDFGLPGMRVLQLELNDAASSRITLRRFDERCVAYTGTHDNDTSRGWFDAADEASRRAGLELVGGDGRDIAERMIRWVWSTDAAWAIAPMQDILSLGSGARMNVPGRRDGNWGWRLLASQVTGDLAARVREWNQESGRLG